MHFGTVAETRNRPWGNRIVKRTPSPRHVDAFDHRKYIVAEHEYIAADGDCLCTVVRYRDSFRSRYHGHVFLPRERCYVQATRGGWFRCDPDHPGLPPEDAWEGPLPLYALPTLLAMPPSLPVAVVDSEGHADAINACGRMPAVCAFGGPRSNDRRTDWMPLQDRNVIFIASASDDSRSYLNRLAYRLSSIVADFRLVPTPDRTGFGAAEAAAKGRPFGASIDAWLDPASAPSRPTPEGEIRWAGIRAWLDPLLAASPPAPADDLEPLRALMHRPLDTGPSAPSIAQLLREGYVEDGLLIVEYRPGHQGNRQCRTTAAKLGLRFIRGRLVMALNHVGLRALWQLTAPPPVDLDDMVLGLPGAQRYHSAKELSRASGNCVQKAASDKRDRTKQSRCPRAMFDGTVYRAVVLPPHAALRLGIFSSAPGDESAQSIDSDG